MIQGYSQGRFEWFVVATVIAIIALAVLSRYLLIADDVRVLRFEMLSHRFMTSAANARVEYLVASLKQPNVAARKNIVIAGRRVFFSSQGWPVSVAGPIEGDYQPDDADCFQLWNLLLQNPAPVVQGNGAGEQTEGDKETFFSGQEYQVIAKDFACRYLLVSGKAFFDYYPLEGRLLFVRNNN